MEGFWRVESTPREGYLGASCVERLHVEKHPLWPYRAKLV